MKISVSNGSLVLAGWLVILGLNCLLTGHAGYRSAYAEGIHVRAAGIMLVLVGLAVLIPWTSATIKARKIIKTISSCDPKPAKNIAGEFSDSKRPHKR